MLKSRPVAFVLASVLSLDIASQVPAPALAAPPDILAGFELDAGTVQMLTLPARSAGPFDVRVHLGELEHTLSLAPHDVRAADFQLLVHDATGIHRLPTPASVTFRGTVSGLDGAAVAASLIDGQLHATIHLADGAMWGIEPLAARNPAMPHDGHVVYRARDVRSRDVRCGVAAPAIEAAPERSHAPAALRIAELAVDADLRFYTLSNSNPTTVQNRVVTVINGCNAIYRRDCEIEYSITTILVRTTNVYNWSGDLCNLLGQFRSRWNSTHTALRRDIQHLFTGEGTFSGVVGCAYVGVVCGTSAYGASKVYSGNVATDVGLVAHEMGHNWNAPHCDAQGGCSIMCSGLGGCTGNLGAFEPYSANIIIAHRNSRTCLSNPVAPAVTSIAPDTVTSWTPAPVELTGTNLGSVTSVTMAGLPVNFSLTTPSTLRFTPRSPFPIGTHQVVVTNSVGSSSPVNLRVIGNHPCALEVSPILLRTWSMPFTLHSDVNWVGLPFLSFSNQPSSAPGLVELGIGNSFTDLIQLTFLVAGSTGAATLWLPIPPDLPIGALIYSQMVAFDPGNITLPLEASNVGRSEVR